MATTHRRTPLALAVALGGVLALAACSGASNSGGSAAASGAASAPGYAAGPAGGSAAGSGGGSSSSSASSGSNAAKGGLNAAVVQARVVRTASVVIQVDGELAPAAARVRAAAQSLGGFVTSETTTYGDGGGTGIVPATPAVGSSLAGSGGAASTPAASAPAAVRAGESVLVLRVPEPSLDRALDLVSGPGGVGKELNRTTSAQDVTGDLADLDSRVSTQRASVTRVRALMNSAKSLNDVVLLESEVSKRESDLEALEARRATLADQADLATLTVDLRTPAAIPVTKPAPEANPFLKGLRAGWDAVAASTTVVVTVLGAVLPVAVVAALFGVPVLWVLRRRRTARVTPPADAPGA